MTTGTASTSVRTRAPSRPGRPCVIHRNPNPGVTYFSCWEQRFWCIPRSLARSLVFRTSRTCECHRPFGFPRAATATTPNETWFLRTRWTSSMPAIVVAALSNDLKPAIEAQRRESLPSTPLPSADNQERSELSRATAVPRSVARISRGAGRPVMPTLRPAQKPGDRHGRPRRACHDRPPSRHTRTTHDP